MKKILLLLLSSFLFSFGYSQNIPPNMNLVPNGSFELFGNGVISPELDTAFSNPACWIGATKNGWRLGWGWDDTYPCSGRFANARTGKYQATLEQFGDGLWSRSQNRYIDTFFVRVRYGTFPETRLLKPLVAGTTYYLTFYLGTNRSDSCDGCNYFDAILKNFGVRFDTVKLFDTTSVVGGGLLNNRFPKDLPAQINFFNWTPTQTKGFGYTKFTAAYTAQGGEQYMTFGTFSWLKD